MMSLMEYRVSSTIPPSFLETSILFFDDSLTFFLNIVMKSMINGKYARQTAAKSGPRYSAIANPDITLAIEKITLENFSPMDSVMMAKLSAT